MIKNILGIFITVILLSACAPIVKEVKVEYTPIKAPAAVERKSSKQIRVEPFTDKRVGDALGEIPGQYGSLGK